jgi:hypothetical protein
VRSHRADADAKKIASLEAMLVLEREAADMQARRAALHGAPRRCAACLQRHVMRCNAV